MSLTSGSRLGAYEVLAPLGAGGMGEVWRARDTRLGRDVAIKVRPAAVATDADRLARFEREARTVAGLNHPNIVVLHSVEEHDGVRFLTMELVEGQTLADHVAPGGLPTAKLLEIAIPLADALAAAHERGVIHRDLKPGNVMLTREGRVKVLDFGLARVAGDGAEPDRTMAPLSGAGEILGTIPYMAPEQLRGGTADARSDVFALGILLYELATGRRPFIGDSHADVSSAILRDPPVPMPPGDLERLVRRCLEKNPRDRIQTALDVSKELRAIRRGLERGGSPSTGGPQQVASIAVLPFANRSADANDEYFSDGLADELLNVLAKIKGLRVTARTSSFHFKGKDTTIAEIGRTLGVATVLEGSVRKAGNRIRVAVQLVRVEDSSHLWSESYDRTLDDIFAVQDDIAQSVVKELRTTLLGGTPDSDASGQAKADVAQAAKGRATDPEVHRLCLQATYLLRQSTLASSARGIELLKQVLELDPRFALAWAWLGNAYSGLAYNGLLEKEAVDRGREAVARALELEPDLADGYAALAGIQMNHDWDWDGAARSLRRAMELTPASSFVLRRAALLASKQGRFDDALEYCRRALEQDPLLAGVYGAIGITLEVTGRLEEAEAAYRKVVELTPDSILAHAQLSLVLLAQGRGDEALAEAAREPEETYRLWAIAIIEHDLGHKMQSDEALRTLIEKHGDDSAVQVAEVQAVRGEIDAAFEWLERAYEQRDAGVSDLFALRGLRSLQADARWRVFVRKVGLEPAPAP